jgi:hypothetical protein
MHSKIHYIRKNPAVTANTPAVSSTKKDSSTINKIIKALVSK